METWLGDSIFMFFESVFQNKERCFCALNGLSLVILQSNSCSSLCAQLQVLQEATTTEAEKILRVDCDKLVARHHTYSVAPNESSNVLEPKGNSCVLTVGKHP